MGVLHDRVRMTVYGEADGGTDRVRVGTELRPAVGDRFGLQVYAQRQDYDAGPEHLLGLAPGLRF